MYYHKRAHVGLEASKMKKKKLIQVAPYRNPKLTQFVFEQNIWEEPLLAALHLLYYCGQLLTALWTECTVSVQCYLDWNAQCNFVPLLRRAMGEAFVEKKRM